MELTILMPCLNEAETIAQCVTKAKTFLKNSGIKGEVLISDNGSTDGSQSLAEASGARVTHAQERGYGAALLNGIKNSKSRYIIMGDADDSYDFSNLMPFVTKLREGYELVMGNRFRGGIKTGAMPFLNRYLGNPVLSFIGRLFFHCPIKDFHCGLRGFNREAINELKLTATGMEFASEMVVKAALKHLKIIEVPTTLAPDGRSRPPHLRKWRDGWRHLRLLLLFSPRWMFLYPGLLLIALGVLLIGTISYEPFYIGKWRLDIHSLLFASTFVIIGLQAVFFSIFSSIITSVALNLPTNDKLNLFLRKFTLENGLIFGLTMIIVGILGSAFALHEWVNANFGELLPERMMRITIPSVTLLIVGMQTIFSSFFANLIINYNHPNLDKCQ
jgi:glycosyltransferase involved in cell wall biosynthesis